MSNLISVFYKLNECYFLFWVRMNWSSLQFFFSFLLIFYFFHLFYSFVYRVFFFSNIPLITIFFSSLFIFFVSVIHFFFFFCFYHITWHNENTPRELQTLWLYLLGLSRTIQSSLFYVLRLIHKYYNTFFFSRIIHIHIHIIYTFFLFSLL